MSTFSEQVPRANETFQFLPLFHTCDGFFARKHMRRGELVTDDVCEVFNEQVTYLFYGRAAYKYGLTDLATTQLSLYPVCFIFDLELIEDIKRIYPFDSGAMHHDFLKAFMDDKMALADFEIEPDTRRIADIVLKFFDNNANYLNSRPNEREIDTLDFESTAFMEMTRSHVGSGADERRVTIEVQAGKTVPFANGLLKAMIVPIQYLESPFFRDFIDKQGIRVRAYEINVWNPKQSFGVVASAAKDFLRNEGYNV
ncbi:hypothetical protein AC244_01670 [Ensifer adhaerens]|uniref:Uncharacterized protein n=1 Tax=Ensifer adhaerens TaxID=106592 RepID=A0A0L8C682_ENSAD|nr:hypothetical protein [Ensifer adhaerens]KOF22283.1 hypothetical protein AC244_01670 [Ensifer adhaerens]